ncbi:MAG: demethylmenaquinone methyltransferase/2-methoxy-6-polyprenyl-1,4-benzoquinol methylase [Candidatus Azotimanducaceae bacterium]|jgi:demethylmenaquinone methyltransferase/2-methoxy-6-polyprenyl-1,4-benzoquinol methylase
MLSTNHIHRLATVVTTGVERLMKKDDFTHFGFSEVPIREKAAKVAGVFHSVAQRYDIMNDVMSLGTHRVMKQMTANATRARPGHQILDLAGGTGDMAALLSEYVGGTGHVCICDINGSMLQEGRDKLLNLGIVENISFVQADGEQLPFGDNHFNAITVAFGLRNFTDKEKGLSAMFDALRPGGKLVVLEFSKPKNGLLKTAYKGFSTLWPKFGKAVTGDEKSYQYLVESIEMHPDQDTLSDMLEDAGFIRVRYQNLVGGIAAIHEGMKPRNTAST